MNNEKEKSSTSDNSSENIPTPGWSGAHVQFYQAQDMKSLILLDNGYTVNLFCNPNMVSDIKETNEALELSTNGGELRTNKHANVPGYGEVWYDEKAITNIFSFALMEDKYKITYDSTKQKAFVVHLPNKQIRFTQSKNGLYYYKPNYSTNNTSHVNHSIESVDENKKLYTARQVKRAREVRQLYHALGTPSLNNFNH
jgi:hypothetical protein